MDSLHGIRINAIDNDKVRLKLCISAKLRFNRTDTIVVMKNGVVVETGEREAVITAPQHEYTRSLIESLPGAEVSP